MIHDFALIDFANMNRGLQLGDRAVVDLDLKGSSVDENASCNPATGRDVDALGCGV